MDPTATQRPQQSGGAEDVHSRAAEPSDDHSRAAGPSDVHRRAAAPSNDPPPSTRAERRPPTYDGSGATCPSRWGLELPKGRKGGSKVLPELSSAGNGWDGTPHGSYIMGRRPPQEHRQSESWSKQNTKQTCALCEEGWKSLGLKCYYFSTDKLNWTQGRDLCVEKGGHLVIITNQPEQEFVASQIGETHWIGLNDLETEGQWMWVNNEPLNERDVTRPGKPDEPDNWKEEDPAGENCAALGHENGWEQKHSPGVQLHF
ncbi:hypothetical protein QTP70_017065 [Hemibagrus guttatus]|uniref:C-type lectin domain-containing protein n=1 Tax=Hemibagrus guttatus TaxID=175788 RepID=A0AAE0PQN6_9TELE|nr:hypothetical protein QTP70_017065 [Hemibagrus guttatus]